MDDSTSNLAAAFRHLLKPLVRLLLRQGIAFNEISEILKSVYVETARQSFERNQEKPTDSRVAILTGLTRKEVKRMRESLGSDQAGDSAPHAERNTNRATRVLAGWHQDPDFCDTRGYPMALPLVGQPAGFGELVRRYSGDMPPRTMLQELLRIAAVAQTRDDMIHVLKRAYIPGHDDPTGIRILGTAVHDLAATIDHNLSRPHQQAARFQRSVTNMRLSSQALPLFSRIVEERGEEFLESLDDWLSVHETGVGEADREHQIRAGVGLYLFQDSDEQGWGNDNGSA